MASKAGISGVAVAVTSIGGVLVYAGFRGINPLQALREIGGGHPASVQSTPTEFTYAQQTQIIGSSFSAAAEKYAADKYSQPKRQQPGYSDCSSFCDKVFRDMSVPTPYSPWANSANYRMSPQWKTIPASESEPGDIAISGHHMVLVLAPGGTAAIGQQNSRVNVRRGTVADLMSGQSYVYKTFVPTLPPRMGKVR